MTEQAKLLDTVWIMRTRDVFFYPIQPTEKCKPERHGNSTRTLPRLRIQKATCFGGDRTPKRKEDPTAATGSRRQRGLYKRIDKLLSNELQPASGTET